MKHLRELLRQRWFAMMAAGCITVTFYLLLSHLGMIWGGITTFVGYFSTVIWGCIIAYLMNPLAMFLQRTLLKSIPNRRLRWTVSIFLTTVIILTVFILIISMLIPQLVDSVATFSSNLGDYANALKHFIREKAPQLEESEQFHNLFFSSESIINHVVDLITDNYSKILDISAVTGKYITTTAVAFILSIYLLGAKQRLQRGIMRFMHATMERKNYHRIIRFTDRCNHILNRYVTCSVIDALIVGCANAVFMAFGGMQYVGLVSVVVGLTNLVPTFGPIVGGAIGGFILLMVKPVHALVFIIFTIILQTVDGYIIKPKLYGNTLGVSGLLILIMILVGGQIAKVPGILLGIPMAAIVDYIYRDALLPGLEKSRRQGGRRSLSKLAKSAALAVTESQSMQEERQSEAAQAPEPEPPESPDSGEEENAEGEQAEPPGILSRIRSIKKNMQ